VCTTEFIALANADDEFQAMNTELFGLSIDSHFSHIAWMRTIEEKFSVEIPFPIIADLSMEVANQYGMIQPGESYPSAVRCTFVIDDKGLVWAMVYYPPCERALECRVRASCESPANMRRVRHRYSGRLAARRPCDRTSAEDRCRGGGTA
jgi:alkyl hydroperoxide reductase subunit AhpC